MPKPTNSSAAQRPAVDRVDADSRAPAPADDRTGRTVSPTAPGHAAGIGERSEGNKHNGAGRNQSHSRTQNQNQNHTYSRNQNQNHTHSNSNSNNYNQKSNQPQNQTQTQTQSQTHGPHTDSDDDANPVAAPTSLLQPRVAVVLGVPRRWHLLLFVCRLLSIAPAIWWGMPSVLRLLAKLHLWVFGAAAWAGVGGSGVDGAVGGAGIACIAECGNNLSMGAAGWGGDDGGFVGRAAGFFGRSFEARLRLTETCLAIIWCGASAYLSFVFTDCLMSRWLVNYTPQATLVRLLTISALNAYSTSWVLYLTGASEDKRLLLPAWVAIATTLTALYHVTQRKINIRKETSISISVFSIASFTSMVILLAQLYSHRTDTPSIPLLILARRAWLELGNVTAKVLEYGNVTKEL